MSGNDHDLAPLYAIDALSVDETRDFESHLADCVVCQEEVADMRRVTEHLTRAVESDPPPSLRATVLAGITNTPQQPVTAEGRPTATARVVTLHRRRPSRLPYLVAAASVLLAMGFGGWALQSRHDAQQASDQQTQILQALGAPDVRTVTKTSPSGGSGTVVLSRSTNRALFVADGLPALPDNKVYELWTISGAPVPAGTFRPGTLYSLVTLPPAALSANQIAMTVEPKGGSAHPTTAVVMALPLPAA